MGWRARGIIRESKLVLRVKLKDLSGGLEAWALVARGHINLDRALEIIKGVITDRCISGQKICMASLHD